jgi:hypothetical protein
MQFNLNTARPADGTPHPGNASTSIAMSFRTDAHAHCDQIRALLYPWLTHWTETFTSPSDSTQFTPPFDMNSGMDVEAHFELDAQAPGLMEVRWLISHLIECGLAVETLEISARYKGARLQADKLDLHMTAPSRAVVNMALRALRQFQERSTDSAAKAAKAWQALWREVDYQR